MGSIDSICELDSESISKGCVKVSPKIYNDLQTSSSFELDEEDEHDKVKLPKCHKIKRIIYSDDEEIFEKPPDIKVNIEEYADKMAIESSLTDVPIDDLCEFRELDKNKDAEINSDNEDSDNEEITLCAKNRNGYNVCKDKNTKNDRKSAKFSDRTMADEHRTIQSEQQRLHREAHINVPYHKPKKHTLQEFLQRRTIIKPELINNNENSNSPTNLITNVFQRKKTSKMTAEELEIYAQHMEERAKECSEFFKSDDDNDNKNNDGIYNDKLVGDELQQQIKNITCVSESTTLHEINSIEECEKDKSVDYNSDNVQQLTDKDLEDILQQEHFLIKSSNLKKSSPSTEISDSPQMSVNTSKKQPFIDIKKLLRNKPFYNNSTLCEADMIDLDNENINAPYNGHQVSNTDRLMERLMKNCKEQRNSTNINCNNKLEMSAVNVSIKVENNKLLYTSAKPGEAYLKFKRYLKEIINNKRLEELKKKQNENQKDEQDKQDDDYDDENWDSDNYKKRHTSYELDEEINEEDNELLEEEEEDIQTVDKKNISLSENDDNVDEDDDDGDDDGDKCSKVRQEDEVEKDEIEEGEVEGEIDIQEDDQIKNEDINITKKRIIIKPCCDENDSDNDDINFLRTQSISSLREFESNALYALDESEEKVMTPIISQIPTLQNNNQTCVNNNNEKEVEELIELCSGSFQTQSQHQNNATNAKMDDKITFSNDIKVKHNKLLSSDDDETNDEMDENYDEKSLKLTDSQKKKKIKRLRKRVKKNRTYNLSISEDDDENKNEENGENLVENDENLEERNAENVEQAESSVAYDSEESLIQISKNERLKQAKQFLEHEAQLSESDWDSADEDEENLNRYDMELGDEELFDQKKLHHELEKIHARKMLDEDIREVRRLKEIFLEDQEEGSAMRQRQFRWRNINEGNLSLDDMEHEQQDENNELCNKVNEEEMSEQVWRKNRYEREKLLEKYKAETDINNSSVNDKTDLNGKRFEKIFKKDILDVETTSIDRKTQSSFLIAKDFNLTRHRKIARESFLLRDQEILHKVANLSKDTIGSIFHIDDATPTLMINTNKPKNFTFTTLTAEEHANLKRKPKDTFNISNEQEEHQQLQEDDDNATSTKKLKLERRNKCLIDQLL